MRLKITSLLLLLIFVVKANYGQTDSIRKFSTDISFGINQSLYSNSNYKSDAWWNQQRQVGFGVSVGVNYQISLKSKIGLALGISSYKNKTELVGFDNSTFPNKALLTDEDNDNYYLITKANSNDQNKMVYIDLPLNYEYEIAKLGKIALAAKAGIVVSYCASASYSSSGNVEYSGYYPKYKVELYNLTDYDFVSKTISEDAKWDLSKTNISANVGLQFSIPMNTKAFIISANFRPGISNIGYSKAKHEADLVSLYDEPGTTKLNSFSLMMGIRF